MQRENVETSRLDDNDNNNSVEFIYIFFLLFVECY